MDRNPPARWFREHIIGMVKDQGYVGEVELVLDSCVFSSELKSYDKHIQHCHGLLFIIHF